MENAPEKVGTTKPQVRELTRLALSKEDAQTDLAASCQGDEFFRAGMDD